MDVGDVVLIVAAHPDDEILGAGASAARWVAEGKSVFSLILAEGVSSRFPEADQRTTEGLVRLRDHALRAHEIVGDQLLPLGKLRDNRMDAVPLLEIVKQIEKVIVKVQPSCVLTHGPWDVNVDHRRTHEAALAACRAIPGSSVRLLACFPILSSTEWRGDPQNAFSPNLFVDVSAYETSKADALLAYADEVREAPHPRSPSVALAQMTVWGSFVGASSAEAFQVVRWII